MNSYDIDITTPQSVTINKYYEGYQTLSAGTYPTYDSSFAPYPLGALLWYPAGGYFVKSIIADNAESDLTDTTKWAKITVSQAELAAQAAEFQDALSGKVDLATGATQADVDYVIETYTNGTDWYRTYKSGWCEQGGQTNIASGSGNYSLVFLQEFADTNYNFLCQPETTDTSTIAADRLGVYRIIGAVYSKSTTGVQIQYDAGTYTGKFFWRAEGYLAQGD